MKIPEIRIDFSWTLFATESEVLAKLYGHKLRSYDEYQKYTEEFRIEWKKHESEILTYMQETLGLEFYNPIIDVSLAPCFMGGSDPLVLGFLYEPDEFVDTLTHELLHVLLTDNKVVSIKGSYPSYDLKTEWESLFGFEDDFNALVHVLVHAVHKKIYLELLKEESRLTREEDKLQKNKATSYQKAWDYVDKHGADSVIEKLKKSYKKMAVELGAKK